MTTNGNEPLVALWAERNKWLAACNVADDECVARPLFDKLSAIEDQIIKAKANTLAGVLVQIKVYDDVIGHRAWIHGAELTRNVVKALERMGGVAVVGM